MILQLEMLTVPQLFSGYKRQAGVWFFLLLNSLDKTKAAPLHEGVSKDPTLISFVSYTCTAQKVSFQYEHNFSR